MKDFFEKFRKTPEKPKETAPSHPYRNSISEQDRRAITDRQKADNVTYLKKTIRALDRYELSPDPETVLRLHALAARLLDEELPAGSPDTSVLDGWLAELAPHQKDYLMRSAVGGDGWFGPFFTWDEKKHGAIRDRLDREREAWDKRRRK